MNGLAAGRGIPTHTIEKVLKGAKELNYVPNLLVRSLRSGRTNVIYFYSAFRDRFSTDLYMDRISSSLMVASGEAKFDVLFHCNFDRTTRETFEILSGGFADGLILFAPEPNDPLLEMLREGDLPVVIMNRQDPRGQFSSVYASNAEGMRLVADALIGSGHRRIAAIDVPQHWFDGRERIQLLRTYLAESGVELIEDALCDYDHDKEGIIKRLLALPDPPTALFCWHDRVAYWVLESCQVLGIDVPSQLSVVGYDGLRWPAATHHEAASVVVDLDSLSARAVQALRRQIETRGPATCETVPLRFSHGSTLGSRL
jgi:DNA-binding LacI/PurR family transcriptional regulator